jgi:ribosomal protein S18 acetylase RimI-like enzyme
MIRLATEEDFEAILDMSAEFWLHTQFEEPFERVHTLSMVELAHSQGLLAVVDVDGPVGFCAAVKAYTMGSSQAWAATELAFWLNPECRGGKHGVALLQFMEKLVQEQKIKYWTMVAMESSMPEVIGKMYEKMGYVRSETSYTKVFDYGSDNIGGSGSGSDCIQCESQ